MLPGTPVYQAASGTSAAPKSSKDTVLESFGKARRRRHSILRAHIAVSAVLAQQLIMQPSRSVSLPPAWPDCSISPLLCVLQIGSFPQMPVC